MEKCAQDNFIGVKRELILYDIFIYILCTAGCILNVHHTCIVNTHINQNNHPSSGYTFGMKVKPFRVIC